MNRILIIEDEQAIAELQKDYLELSGFEVEAVHDGSEGLMRVLKEDFRLVVLDLMLPGIDGFEICKLIKMLWKNTWKKIKNVMYITYIFLIIDLMTITKVYKIY